MVPGEHSDTKMKSLALASGHGRYRYTTATIAPERACVLGNGRHVQPLIFQPLRF
jgi:hypothetical protein